MLKYGLGCSWIGVSLLLGVACSEEPAPPAPAQRLPARPAPRVDANAASGAAGSQAGARAPAPAASGGDASVRDAQADDGGAPPRPEPSDAGSEADPAAADSADSGPSDSDARPDSERDAAVADGGTREPGCRDFVAPADCRNADGRPLPAELRCTGLYGDWEAREPACGVSEYAPAYELWSDGARKRRFISLPEGEPVDATRPDGFVFPAGTQLWKEFRVETPSGEERLAETRLLRKVDSPRPGWLYTSYVWNEAQTSATLVDEGVEDLYGTGHDVPTLDQCRQCHVGRDDFVLGWDPVLLGEGSQGVDLESLAAAGRVMLPPAGAATLRVPGDEVERAALGYLHANCGVSCHNPNGDAKDSGLFLRLDADSLASVGETPAIRTGLYKRPWENAKLQTLEPPVDSPFYAFAPQRRDASLVLVRMLERGGEAQMPPIASRRVDEPGAELIGAFIDAMQGPEYEQP
jgi:hypothetical protein